MKNFGICEKYIQFDQISGIGKQSAAGIPPKLGLIIEHITMVNEL
jgi:hypothetical protein